MGKILIMGQIPDDFNVDKHIALGPFCFLGKENIYPKWEQIKFIPDPFDTPESLFENNKKLVLFTLKIIPELIAFLNKEKCTNKSELFWKPILYPWLYSFLETLWERQNRLINFVNAHKNNEISVRLITSNFKWSFIDTLDFQSEGIMNILFNEWLFSRIIEENLPKKWNAIYIDKSNECNLARKSKVDPRKENFLKEKIINELSKYGFNEIYGLNLKEQFEFNRAVKKRKGKKVNLHSTNEKILDEIANVTALEWKFDYKTILYECMPDSILETDIKWAFEKAKGKQLYFVSSSILFGDNRIKPLIGAIREMGGKVISVQHGGHPYGTGGSYYLAQGNEYINDGFITWGWEEQNDFIGNFIPLSSPMLSKLENKHIEQNDELIFISTLPRMISHRLQSTPQPVQQLEYMAFKKYFLSTLDGDIIKNFRYRYYPHRPGSLNDKSYMENFFPEIVFCTGDLDPQILKCRLIVLDHVGTTLNKALSANIPIIAYWNYDHSSLSSQSKKHFELLEEAGILHDSPVKAANKVNEIWEDVQGWWNKGEVQVSRNKWCKEFAKTSQAWKVEWKDFIREL